MRTISFRDLLVAEELSHIPNEIALLDPSNDGLVKHVLEYMGFDTKQDVIYEASKHRDMKGVVAVGFMAVGEYSRKKEHRHFLDSNDRIILAGQVDASLGKELAEMAGRRNTYKNQDQTENTRHKPDDPRYYTDAELLELGYTDGNSEEVDPFEGDYIEPDWEETLRAIKVLEDILIEARKGN